MNILVAYEYKVKLSIVYYTSIVLMQSSKPFTSISKTLVYTKATKNNAHGYTRPGCTYLQITKFLLAFVSFFHDIFN